MQSFNSFPNGTRAAVIGATGGIGRAIVDRLADSESIASIHAFSRREFNWKSPKVVPGLIDIEDEASIRDAAKASAADDALDLVIVATGMLGSGEAIKPEKAMREIDGAALEKLYRVNAVGPVLVAKHFLPRLRKRSRTVFAALSARVGSIGDNRLGGWYAYRASKSALNMLLKTLAIEHARQWPESVVVGLHPGTVDTSLSRPFTGRTPKDKLFSVEQSAGYLLSVVDEVRPGDSGSVFAWDGSRIEH